MGPGADVGGGAGSIRGGVGGKAVLAACGPMGANRFLVALLLGSITLATGLAWLAVMDRIGAWTLAIPGLLSKFARVSSRKADQWQKTRALREEREEVRRVDRKSVV